MQPVLVLLPTALLLSSADVVVPASDGWPAPVTASVVGGLGDPAAAAATELAGDSHSPAVNADEPQTSLSGRRRRRRQKHHHHQKRGFVVCMHTVGDKAQDRQMQDWYIDGLTE